MAEDLFFIGYAKKKNKVFLYFLFFYFPKLVYYPFIILSFLSFFFNPIKVFFQQYKMYLLIFGFFFIALDIIFRFFSKQFFLRRYIKFDANKNIEFIEKDEDEKETVLEFIKEEKIKSFTCNKAAAELKMEIENRVPLYFELDKKLYNKLKQEYPNKIIEENLEERAIAETLNSNKITVGIEDAIVQYAKNPIGYFLAYKWFAFGNNPYFPIYIRFEGNRNLVLFILNKDKTERIIKVIPEENIKSITYKKMGGCLYINLNDEKQIEILLEFLNEQQQVSLVNTLVHNYIDKITPKVVEEISRLHQAMKITNPILLFFIFIIGLLFVYAMILSIIRGV